jgi:hypothetical protein
MFLSSFKFSQLLVPYEMRFASRVNRINQRLRKYRVDKINKESSFNKQEGRVILLTTVVLSAFYSKKRL